MIERKVLSVIIPVYQNEGSLPLLAERLRIISVDLEKLGIDLYPVFINDGSTDGSGRELFEIKQSWPQTKIITLTRNFGAINAIKCGFTNTEAHLYALLAADLQDPPEILLDMVIAWQEGHKFVVCERENRDDPLSSRLFSKLFYFLLRLLVLKDFPKGGFDLVLFDRDIRDVVVNSGKSTYIHTLLWWLGYKPYILKYERSKRVHGKSKWSIKKKINAFIDIFINFSILPLRMLSFFGIVMTVLSFGYAFYVLFFAVTQGTKVPGFATLAILLSFFMGSFFLSIGILGEYIWRIHSQLNGRPESVILSIY
jgi:polyisoprenyl-phosphate glycosyltransferase